MVRYTGREHTEVGFMPDFAPGPHDAASSRYRLHAARQRTITLPAADRRLMHDPLADA
jgi:hypothetical protein